MPEIKYAIFDIGQTIYPFTLQPLITHMQRETTEPKVFARNHSPRFYDYNPYMKGEMTDVEFAEELCFFCRVPYNENRLQEINTALHQGCGERFSETLKAINLLRQHGTNISLLSNALPLLADTGTDITKPDLVFTSYNLGLLKPDTAIFQTVLNKLNTAPEQTLFLDDKKANVEAAQSLGMNGIVYHPKTVLKELATYLQPHSTLSRSREA